MIGVKQQTCSAFFFNDTATTEIYTLSLHDALPICWGSTRESTCSSTRTTGCVPDGRSRTRRPRWSASGPHAPTPDRKSTRLNSSHANISYAVFCLKKKQTYKLQHWLASSCATHPFR